MRPYDILWSGCREVRVWANNMDEAIEKAVILIALNHETPLGPPRIVSPT